MFFSRFNRFIKYFGKGYKLKLLNILFMAFMSSLLEFLSIVLVFPFIMIMVNPGRVVYNPLARYFHELLHINSVPGMILFFGSLIAGVIIIKNLYSILITYWQNKMINGDRAPTRLPQTRKQSVDQRKRRKAQNRRDEHGLRAVLGVGVVLVCNDGNQRHGRHRDLQHHDGGDEAVHADRVQNEHQHDREQNHLHSRETIQADALVDAF